MLQIYISIENKSKQCSIFEFFKLFQFQKVMKMGQKMSIELFVYTLCKTTVNCRMLSKNLVAFFLLPVMSCVR